MKRLIMLFLLVSTLQVYGQTDYNRFQIGFSFSPDIAYRTLLNREKTDVAQTLINTRNDNERVKFGYTTGFNFVYNFSSMIGLEAGIHYSNKGYQTRKINLITLPIIQLPEAARTRFNFHYLEIPIKANFTFGNGDLRFITSVGFATNFLLGANETTILYYPNSRDINRNGVTNSYRRVNISPMVSVGLDYRINDRMNVRVEPTFRYGVINIIDSPIGAHVFNAGLNLSYYFGL